MGLEFGEHEPELLDYGSKDRGGGNCGLGRVHERDLFSHSVQENILLPKKGHQERGGNVSRNVVRGSCGPTGNRKVNS